MSCCEEAACSHAVVAAATKEATHLTDKEREIILGVLCRDERLRRDQQIRVMHLKAELQSLRRKGALKPSDWDSTGPDPDRTCGRCRIELGRVINRGAYCRACRLKVCKACREYSFRTTDWVCTVCHKHMEIQAASGEWMNEFVRRPSRRRDNRVYVPAADIIKRTIRRSWTISNPTPRWSALRGSPELRPYNSLPRGQDINSYPSLTLHQANLKNQDPSVSPIRQRRSPTRRTQSEDVYIERGSSPVKSEVKENCGDDKSEAKRQVRVNPLMKLAETRQDKSRTGSPKRKKSESKLDSAEDTSSSDSNKKQEKSSSIEKRVSFDSNVANRVTVEKPVNVLRTQSLNDGKPKEKKSNPFGSRSLPEEHSENFEGLGTTSAEIHYAREETTALESCDIEPLSGTVFRKVTVRRRRQENMRKVPAVDTGWRRGPDQDLLDILLPEGDDYKLVFISSDSSSKEEDVDDNDSSSTASSFPIDECDWDYFEPGGSGGQARAPVLTWTSPYGSPRVYRRGGVTESPIGSPTVYRRTRESDTGTDDDQLQLDSPASSESLYQPRDEPDKTVECLHNAEAPLKPPCHSCGAANTQYIPIPVPVPIPFPVWANPQESMAIYQADARLKSVPRGFWPYVSLIWPLMNAGEPPGVHIVGEERGERTTDDMPSAAERDQSAEASSAGNNEDNKEKPPPAVQIVEEELTGYLDCENRDVSSSDTSGDSSDSSDTSGNRKPRVRRVYNVNGGDSRQSDDALPSSNVTSDCDEEEVSHSSVREDDMSSSGSEDTDSDDTGTVADQKPKRFSRIFVVNKNVSSSSNDSTSSDSDTSDNDTDTEMDCTVILTNIKHLDTEAHEIVSNSSGDKEIVNDNGEKHDANNNPDCDNDVDNSKVREKDLNDSRDHVDKNSDCDKKRTGEVSEEEVKVIDKSIEYDKNAYYEKKINNKDDLGEESEKVLVKGSEYDKENIDDNEEDPKDDLQKESKQIGVNDIIKGKDNVDEDAVKTTQTKKEARASKLSAQYLREELEKVLSKTEAGIKETGSISSSPGLSDVSAESLNSSDVEQTPLAADDAGHTSSVEILAGEGSEPRDGVRAGGIVLGESEYGLSRNAAARYTSLVMITQEPVPAYQQVSVVTSDTTTLVADGEVVVVRHTNWQDGVRNEDRCNDNQNPLGGSVTVITGGDTLSAFEEGLADDDSWVENLSHGDDDDEFPTNSPTDDSSSGEEVTLTCSAAIDQEDELRGYHRTAIDFTLHTIVEESCEESEVEQNAPKKERPASATDLEKYFFFGLGDGTVPSINSNREDAFSETSSIYSEGMESLGGTEENQQQTDNSDPAELASSRLEKYFLSGFMGFTAERRDSDGSVGSDSEGRPSPEQRRKRLVRARGTGRSHSSSLDNLDNAGNDQTAETQINSEDSSSSDSDTYDEINSFEKSDGQFDTVKRKKAKKQKNSNTSPEEGKSLEVTQEVDEKEEQTDEDEDGHKTPQPEILPVSSNLTTNKNQQSRDSGFIGSCDDLIKEQRENNTPELPLNKIELKTELENIMEEKKLDDKLTSYSTPPATSLTRKDSFNNWSSDEETNLMMCKMRQFFKTMVANSQCNTSSKPTTPNLSSRMSPKPLPSPRAKNRCKPPQLVYFENELTRLMKTVPGIRDDQVKEIVEYLSSEDTWSDSYDSSDYTSSDLEGASTKSALQQQISDSCKQIINKFDTSVDDEGDEGDGGIVDESHGLSKETAFVYQKLVASFEKMAAGDDEEPAVPVSTPHNSPPLIAKVMHHIGSRLVALMHEVSSGESHKSTSPKAKHYHRRLQHKISSASSTTTEDDCNDTSPHDTFGGFEEKMTPYLLPRSRSHDLLVGESRTSTQSSGGDITEEREASDCERFSWRGSFESALLASDSRNKLSLLGGEGSASASALAIAAKRRSAGDLLFSHKSLSREQLDRVRSCGSIGGANSEDKLWVASATRPNRRRSSVPDASCGSGGSADGEDEDEEIENRSTFPRSLQSGAPTTNSLPRLPTNVPASNMQKSQSMYHFLPQNVKSARYRPPGFNRLITTAPKRAVSAPGLQPSHQRRVRRSQQQTVTNDDVSISEAHSSPMLASRSTSKSATPSPVAPGSRRGTGSVSSQEWQNDDDIDRLVGLHHNRNSLSSLGVRSDSMASVYSGAGEGRYGTVTVRGQVEFGLQYNYKAGALEIQIKQCKDLAPVDAKRNRSDPYVKVYLLPDKSKSGKRKTKVKKHTLNPVFDECLKFHISLNGLETRTLWLTVWHSDMFGRNDFLGEVMMALENKVFDDPTPKWYNLQERTEPFDDVLSYKGDIIVCLKFVPPDMTVPKKGKRSRGALHVLVKEAKALTAIKANGTSDPFCKSYLLPDKGRNSKQKTPIARKTVNPVWNYTFVYDDVTLQELAERCLELTVWDHDRLASNEFLGGVRFSLGTGKHYGKTVDWMDASGKELSLWKNMLERPNFWVEGCLSLRSSLDTRAT